MYSAKHKFIFIPTRKCGGMSIERALSGYTIPSHLGLYNLGVMSTAGYGNWNEELKSNFIFSSVRNPYDKTVSNYHYSNKGQKIWGVQLSFENFCTSLRDRKQPEHWRYHTIVPAKTYLWDGDLVTDKIIRFENLASDFKEVCAQLNIQATLPHINKSRNNREYKSYYTLKSKQIISLIFEEDLDLFKYTY